MIIAITVTSDSEAFLAVWFTLVPLMPSAKVATNKEVNE